MRRLKVFGLLVVALALSLAFIACNSGTGDVAGPDTGSGGDDRIPWGTSVGSGNKGGSLFPTPSQKAQVLTFTDGEYTIEITENLNIARYTPQSGDFYKVYIGGELVSEGTVTLGETTESGGITLIFTPSDKAGSLAESFTATFEDGVLSIIGGEIVGEDGEKITIPPLSAVNYEAGKASTRPVINDKTVAGIAYSKVDKGSYTNEATGTHYLISVNDFGQALEDLKKAWGEPDWTDGDLQTYGTSIAQGILESGEGVLFEVNNYKNSDSGGTDTGLNYRLGTRELVMTESGYYYHFKAVEWYGGSTWASNDGGSYTQPGVVAPVLNTTAKTLTFSGATEVSLEFTKKEDYPKIGPTKNDSAYYFLESSFDDALAIFRKLWGDPLWNTSSFWNDDDSTSSIGPIDRAIFAVFKSTYADNSSEESYGLFRYSSKEDKWLGVGWWLQQ